MAAAVLSLARLTRLAALTAEARAMKPILARLGERSR